MLLFVVICIVSYIVLCIVAGSENKKHFEAVRGHQYGPKRLCFLC